MRKRYTRSESGRLVESALVFTQEDHHIDTGDLDHDAVKVVRRLQQHGYEAYIVGGAVRDLLLGKHPKDFDVSSSATPTQIRRLFRNSRVIGKRFRLVHILFRDKVLEVSTFRSQEAAGFKNVYGTLEEDVRRRDFTANALFYNPRDNTVIDFVSGLQHIRKRVLRPVIPLDRIFVEDPVRIIRAIKYSVTGGLRLPWLVRRRIHRDRPLLADVPSSRMTEELFKILNSGHAAPIIDHLLRYNALQHLTPRPAELARTNSEYRRKLIARLSLLDAKRRDSGAMERKDLLVSFAADYLLEFGAFDDQKRIPFRDGYFAFKDFLFPVTPANREVEGALREIFRNKGRLLREEPPEDTDADGTSAGGRPRRRRGGRRRGGRVPAARGDGSDPATSGT
ncbi:MAG: polynucleotide adenylyltransferase PcnB [Spirochaetaceae bacterium]|nr:MAG: polynucleotide adenylyltransferase PcnB [Spirochaetaceae bacterium]